MLLEENTGAIVEECHIRYHADNVVVSLVLDDAGRAEVRAAVQRARELRASLERPPVTTDERKCVRCSLAPVCLPEEERLARDPQWRPIDLSVKDSERRSLHVLSHGARIGKRGDELEIVTGDGAPVRVGIGEVGSVVIHGSGQISTQALIGVGLEPAFGMYHQPRSSAPPLALDLMELFRVPLVDMPVIASINRGQWDVDEDFSVAGERVWLSDAGKRKFIEVYERRKGEQWRHSVVGYSLSWGRMIELEARLLEKEWSGAEGLFARFCLR
jgi:hypothetical protein